MIDWACIHSVFLDLDGTLLDLHYDNHFWLEHVPVRYAQRHGLDHAEARDVLNNKQSELVLRRILVSGAGTGYSRIKARNGSQNTRAALCGRVSGVFAYAG